MRLGERRLTLTGGQISTNLDRPTVGIRYEPKHPVGVDDNGRAIERPMFIGDPQDTKYVSEYLGRQLNLNVLKNREKSLVDAISSPENWLKERNIKLDQIQGELAQFYQAELATFYQAGYSVEQAQARAEKSTNAMLQIKLEDLEAIQPGANTIYANATFQMQDRNNRARLYAGDAESSVDERAIYKKYRAKKKAKKARKAAKQARK